MVVVRLLGSLTLAVCELIDGVASDCHDDCSPLEYTNVWILESSLIAGYVAIFASAVRFK
jgi:hypothetical protein